MVLNGVLFSWDSARGFKLQLATGHSAIPAQQSLDIVSDCLDKNALPVLAQSSVLSAEPEVVFLTGKSFNRCSVSKGTALPPVQSLHKCSG